VAGVHVPLRGLLELGRDARTADVEDCDDISYRALPSAGHYGRYPQRACLAWRVKGCRFMDMAWHIPKYACVVYDCMHTNR
jgi:hypothetical protein